MDGWYWGFVGAVALIVAMFVGFQAGRESVRDHCEFYGKAMVQGEMLTCSAPK
jgi:hypothetical protein